MAKTIIAYRAQNQTIGTPESPSALIGEENVLWCFSGGSSGVTIVRKLRRTAAAHPQFSSQNASPLSIDLDVSETASESNSHPPYMYMHPSAQASSHLHPTHSFNNDGIMSLPITATSSSAASTYGYPSNDRRVWKAGF